LLIPCIDLQRGQAVQLVHGRRRELAVGDVLGLLKRFASYPWLHVIDLDAAMSRGSNARLVKALCATARSEHGIKVRVGGGIRTVARAAQLTDLGADEIIVGSAVFDGPAINRRFLERLAARVSPARIVIALDTFQGRVTVHGWRRGLRIAPEQVMGELEPYCVRFLCTDVDREGTMSGANLAYFRKLRRATTHPVIAAGGITTKREVATLERIGMDAAVGMAMYKGKLQ
jgi:phosphoribosylformimino-5-aminoimidazole carboxamide ribotide isomerase